MKKIALPVFLTLLVLTACTGQPASNNENKNTQAATQSSTQQSPNNYIYPARNAKIGEKYGEMTLEKIDEKDMFAHFKGEVTVSGSYEYNDAETAFFPDVVCFYLDEMSEIKKIPQSNYFQGGGLAQKSFCFINNDVAKKLLGTGKGTATITINALDDLIDAEGEFVNYATLGKVLTKTEIAPLEIAGLKFTLPTNWTLQKIQKESNKVSTWEVAKIKVPDPKYNVILPMQVVKSDHKIKSDDKLLSQGLSGAKIYQNACAPAIACYYLVYNGNTYGVTFAEVESDQPVPKNLDGVWFPDTIITVEDTLNFMASVK